MSIENAAATGIGERGGIRLGKLCTSLRSLSLPACDKLTPSALEAITLGCIGLCSLNIGYTGAPKSSRLHSDSKNALDFY